MDLLIVLSSSDRPMPDRIAQFLEVCAGYPTDVFPLTETELQQRLIERDPFWTQAMRDAI
jgi:hypothetical protein